MKFAAKTVCAATFAGLLASTPLVSLSQPYGGPQHGPFASPDYTSGRGYIRVTNDWTDVISLFMWTRSGRQIGGEWVIQPGQTTYLAMDNRNITATAEYDIRVGNGWGSVNLGQVASFVGEWRVNVRNIWRATHRGNNDGGGYGSHRENNDGGSYGYHGGRHNDRRF